MPANERLLVIQRDRMRGDSFRRVAVAERVGHVAQQAASLCTLDGRALEPRVIIIHFMSDGPSSPSRGKKAGSRVICTNLGLLKGQRSWEMRRLARFSIPLSTGRRTMRAKPKD
jgi:hypothetical protein